MSEILTIGIAGPSGSGKSQFTKNLLSTFPEEDVLVIQEDAYYTDLSNIPFEQRISRNFDHPSAFDHQLLVENIQKLKLGLKINQPVYNYSLHTRSKDSHVLKPAKIIIIEGILVLSDPSLVNILDICLFLDVDPDICFIRRLRRDLSERGRDLNSIIKQYSETVKPMYFKYIKPSIRNAHLIVPSGGNNKIAVDIVASKISQFLSQQ